MTVSLIQTDSPITRDARNNINENWKRIVEGFTNIQLQINHITDGRDIVELLNRMDKALADSTTTTQTMKVLIDECKVKLAEIQNSINASIDATANANAATNNANTSAHNAHIATINANIATADANTATNSSRLSTAASDIATTNANAATSNANVATNDANVAAAKADAAANTANHVANVTMHNINLELAKMSSLIESFSHIGQWAPAVQYVKNNEVYFMGSTFRAKINNSGIEPPQNFGSNDTWQIVSRHGLDAPSKDDMFKVWRGPTQPPDGSYIWWYDVNTVPDIIINIYKGEVPPEDKQALWLAPRGV